MCEALPPSSHCAVEVIEALLYLIFSISLLLTLPNARINKYAEVLMAVTPKVAVSRM
jgi:hypothetical protein